jgi:hypothetical protein
VILQDTETVTLDVNTRPVLDASKEPSLAAVVEDAPVSAIGSTPVSALIGTLGIANYSDADLDLPGLAITGVSSKGTLHYSTDGGSTWQELSTPPNESSALLLGATARVFFKPNAHFNGSIADAITFKAWDGTFGASGNTGVDTSSPAFSLLSDTASIAISAANDAPGLTDSSAVAATPITEDPSTNDGQTVASLFASRFSDATDQVVDGSSPNTFAGIAVVANGSDLSKGVWEYHNENAWAPIGSASDGAAVLLNASTLVRFAPAQEFSGQAPTLTVRLVESGGTAFADGDKADLSVGKVGDATRYSAGTLELNQLVTPVNDAPSITLPSGFW